VIFFYFRLEAVCCAAIVALDGGIDYSASVPVGVTRSRLGPYLRYLAYDTFEPANTERSEICIELEPIRAHRAHNRSVLRKMKVSWKRGTYYLPYL